MLNCINQWLNDKSYESLYRIDRKCGMGRSLMSEGTILFSGLDIHATGCRIGELIDEGGYTDREIANIMGISVQSINKWRHGKNLPDVEHLYILSMILGITVDDFLVRYKKTASLMPF